MTNKIANYFYILKKITVISLLLISGCTWQKNEKKASQVTKSLLTRRASTITVSTEPYSRTINEKYACFNVNSLLVKSWSNPDFLKSINQVNPRLLRIPGGTESNYWDWQKGGLIKNVLEAMAGYPINFRIKDLKYNDSKLEDIAVGIQETNTVPIFVLNLATSSLESQLEMLRKAKNLGIPVDYIELGNEFYIDVPNYRRVFPTSEDYAQTASRWIDRIKKEFPNAQIALVGVISGSKGSIRSQNWNKNLLPSAMYKADAITLHIYGSHGLSSNIEPNATYPFFKEEEVSIILGQPFRNWQKIANKEQFKLIPQDKQIWLTEYNLFEKIFGNNNKENQQRVMGSWTHGLYALAQSLVFLEDSRTTIACNHVLIGNSRFAAIFRGTGGFVNPSDPNMKVTPLNLTATGSTLSLLGEAISDMTEARKINFSFSPKLIGRKGFEYSALYGWKFSNEQYSNGIIVNLSNQNLKLNIEQLFPVPVKYQQLTENPRTLVTGTEVLKSYTGIVDSELVLPSYSVTQLREIERTPAD